MKHRHIVQRARVRDGHDLKLCSPLRRAFLAAIPEVLEIVSNIDPHDGYYKVGIYDNMAIYVYIYIYTYRHAFKVR